MKRVILLPLAAKALRKHRVDAERILSKIETYARDASTLANSVKALQGCSALRLRVGDYRVIFEETDQEIIVTKIGPRGSVYD
ncbi:type II toxin-antitoxin system RelE/ParE family toxin [Mesorhizobium sp. B2-1-8]|uniref:type II toxin-antitoxin system RelE family toxin n=1 Tax=Mesorhizobium sp. B2-1-8 TaxID=2589967 RepID=UPI00112CE35F|nr:type II toxin-antitoxin system RelE/ParE family toxin [Mesorhizobium sp. B2-1-8]UCI21608.1 type II toxin-antitoxin system RelE/ParE family toxin [Mesorhizobium sp. B2-1-8]